MITMRFFVILSSPLLPLLLLRCPLSPLFVMVSTVSLTPRSHVFLDTFMDSFMVFIAVAVSDAVAVAGIPIAVIVVATMRIAAVVV